MRWPFRRKKKTEAELDAEYEEYRNTTNFWIWMSSSRKAEKIAELKCDKHPGAEFEQYHTFCLIMGDPVIGVCKECDPYGERTWFYYCQDCGWIENWPRGESYRSPEWTWRSLCGRQGSHYFCTKCGKQVGSIYFAIS